MYITEIEYDAFCIAIEQVSETLYGGPDDVEYWENVSKGLHSLKGKFDKQLERQEKQRIRQMALRMVKSKSKK